MSDAITSALEFSHIQATEISKYEELLVRIILDGNVQESLESALDAGVHAWREPFTFVASSVSLCEIHVLAKKRKFFCYAGRFKTIRTTRLQSISELLDTRTSTGAIRLPLYDSTRTDANGAAMGFVEFLIACTSVINDNLKHLSARESVSYREASCAASLRSFFPEAILEKLSLTESDSEMPTSPPPRPKAPSLPASPFSVSPILCPPNVHPQSPLSPSDVLTPQFLQAATLLPQSFIAYSPQRSGVDRVLAEMDTHGHATVHPMFVPAPGILSDDTMTAAPSFIDEDRPSGLAPQGSAETGSFTPVICEPPEEIAFEGSEPWLAVQPNTAEPTSLPTPSEGFRHGIIPQISITLAKSSRGNSPLAPSTCESDTTIKRPSVHVNTGSVTQTTAVTSAHSIFPGVDELSSLSHSAGLASPQPTTCTTNTSSSGLSPFSRTSIAESPSTAATTPAYSAVSEGHKDALASPESHLKQRKERPTIDTSCVGPRGQVKKYRNGSVPPVHVPVKLRNASLDLPRPHEYERFEPNPSLYSIAPSISPRRVKRSGDLRYPSSQPPASRQGLVPNVRAPGVRREALEFDEAQICLDTANLGDQEVATFLKEVDAALSAIVNGSPAVAADSHAFLAVPGATSRLVSRHQSRKPSSQQLRADLSATVRSHEKEGATRTGFSLVATSHSSPHPDITPSRVAPPLSADNIPRFVLSQVDVTPESIPGGPPRSAKPASTFPLPQRVSPQPSALQELVEWVSPSFVSSVSAQTREPPRLYRSGSYYGDVNGNEN